MLKRMWLWTWALALVACGGVESGAVVQAKRGNTAYQAGRFILDMDQQSWPTTVAPLPDRAQAKTDGVGLGMRVATARTDALFAWIGRALEGRAEERDVTLAALGSAGETLWSLDLQKAQIRAVGFPDFDRDGRELAYLDVELDAEGVPADLGTWSATEATPKEVARGLNNFRFTLSNNKLPTSQISSVKGLSMRVAPGRTTFEPITIVTDERGPWDEARVKGERFTARLEPERAPLDAGILDFDGVRVASVVQEGAHRFAVQLSYETAALR